MTMEITHHGTPPRHLLRSAGAVLAGFVTVAALSVGTDQVLHSLAVYPPWGEPMHDPALNVLALAYRCVFTIAGGLVTAWLAPSAPMRHVAILALIGLAAGTAGAIAAITMADLGPSWYPILLAIVSPPLTLVGGWLHRWLWTQ